VDHVAVVENQYENSGATSVNQVYCRVQNVGESSDARRSTPAARARRFDGSQGSNARLVH
jgi:hypothetical protein